MMSNVDKLRSLVNTLLDNLEEYQSTSGLVVHFPCKVGDVIWYVDEENYYVLSLQVKRFVVDEDSIVVELLQTDRLISYKRDISCFGDTLFLNEADALARVEQLKVGDSSDE